jgi:predicted metal-dependent enzyme (double-stranded beta helix superfamily)
MLLGSHSASVNSVTKSGGKKLAGKFLIIGRIRSFVAFFACFHAIEVTMFETDRFVADCRAAFAQDQTHKAVREVLARAVSDPAAVLRGLGEPSRAQIQELFHSDTLTILNVVWAPGMMVMPHNHRMWAAIGIYTGREDNVFWRRVKGTSNKIEAAGARALCEMDAEPLGADVIHSVINPISKLTGAIHIYGGDFFAAERSEWDSETLLEHPWEGERARRVFEEANERYEASKHFRTS